MQKPNVGVSWLKSVGLREESLFCCASDLKLAAALLRCHRLCCAVASCRLPWQFLRGSGFVVVACLLCVLPEARHHVQTLVNRGSFCNPLGKLANVTVAFSLNKKINIDKICRR